MTLRAFERLIGGKVCDVCEAMVAVCGGFAVQRFGESVVVCHADRRDERARAVGDVIDDTTDEWDERREGREGQNERDM